MNRRFYHIDAPAGCRHFARWTKESTLESVTCSEPSHYRWGSRRQGILSVEVGARAVNDFVWSWLHDAMITDRTLDVLRRHAVSGFEVRPLQARPRRRNLRSLPQLYELVVTGWAGLAAPESGLRVKEACPKCHLRWYELSRVDRLINPAEWDGSDFFIVWPMPRLRFVSQRLADILRGEGIGGIELTSAEELNLEVIGLTPGSLSWYMPEERARELGEPLGIYW